MKKFSKKTIGIIISALLVLGIVGGILGYQSGKKTSADERNTYIGLKHLMQSNPAYAEGYLNQVREKTSKKIGFARGCADVIVEQIEGNQTLATVKADLLQKKYQLNDTQETIVKYLIGKSDTGDYQTAIEQIIRGMKISKKNQERYDAFIEMETQAISQGVLNGSLREEYAQLCGEDAASELAITVALSSGNYWAAFQEAMEQTKKSATAQNRLRLASVVADAAYAGSNIPISEFYQAMEQPYQEVNNEKTQTKIAELQEELSVENMKYTSDMTSQELADLDKKIKEIEAEIEKLVLQMNSETVFRALNSIADIPSVEADLVEAKLYYALGEDEKAIKILSDASNSWKRIFSQNEAVEVGLNLINQIYHQGETTLAQKDQTSQMLVEMFDAASGVVVHNDMEYWTLAKALTNQVVSEFKYQDDRIFVSNVDDSNFPEITVSIYGRKAVLNHLRSKKGIELKDTHYPVEYEVLKDDENASMASICFVVDISGSMSGDPINNAREALIDFAQSMDGSSEVALVTFDNGVYLCQEMTTDRTAMLDAINNSVYASGGTDIAQGLGGGLDAVQNATGAKNIILMTDGQSYFDDSVLARAQQEGVTVFTVGFGSVDESLLQRIADETGGSFTLASSSEDLSIVYASLGTMIGNRVSIRYTVTENPDEKPRYVFLRDENLNVSVRQEYRKESIETSTMAEYGYLSRTEVVDRQELVNYGVREIYPSISNSDDVASAELGGVTVELTEDYRTLIFTLDDTWEAGCYPMKVIYKDGSERVFENALYIYDSATMEYYYDLVLEFGNVVVKGSNAILDANGKLCLTRDARIEENRDDTTLAAETNVAVMLQLTLEDAEQIRTFENTGNYYYYERRVPMVGEATFTMDGCLYLDYGDAQDYDAYSISACGKMQGVIGDGQCVISEMAE